MIVNIKKLHEDAVIPSYSIEGDAGLDLTATSYSIDKYGNRMYGTGLAMEIPKAYVGYIFPRSSISKLNLDLANAVGVIDSNYRGEIICKFKPTWNFSSSKKSSSSLIYDACYQVGDRVAQIIIMPLPEVEFNEVEELTNTVRGVGGFGSTNK